MGKAARPFPTGHFRLYKTRQTNNDRPLVVQIEYAVKSVAVRRSTGISVKEKDWNPNENKGRGGVRASYGPDYRNINSRLTQSVSELDSKIAAWCEKYHLKKSRKQRSVSTSIDGRMFRDLYRYRQHQCLWFAYREIYFSYAGSHSKYGNSCNPF